MLDLGSYVKILSWNTWEALGRPKMVFSLIQLCMAIQYCILLIGHLEDVEVDITRVKTYANFEVIDIIRDKDPYPSLLGVDWAFKKYFVIDLKWETMTFKVDEFGVIKTLDPYQGPKFTDIVDDAEETNFLD